MKLVRQLLVTLAFICVLSAPAHPGEMNCGVAGTAPCVSPPSPTGEGVTGTPEPSPDPESERVFWELVYHAVQNALTAF
ncbi:MAG TPA: hypothetical protein VGV38_10995 [Pyrinomonadaceae bacterium]|nr:hypothetical protein [Pyrinomonadaceae bacterium]